MRVPRRCLCDRHFGVGGDGLIMLCPSKTADVRMQMYNADGSRGEMCGNAIRCVARLMTNSRSRAKIRLSSIPLRPQDHRPQTRQRRPRRRCDRPGRADFMAQDPVDRDGRVIDFPLEVAGREIASLRSRWAIRIAWSLLTMTASSRSTTRSSRVRPPVRHHPFFPRRVNTEFIRLLARNRLKMRVWERGSGETLAGGTGACAAQVAAVLTNRADCQRDGRVARR